MPYCNENGAAQNGRGGSPGGGGGGGGNPGGIGGRGAAAIMGGMGGSAPVGALALVALNCRCKKNCRVSAFHCVHRRASFLSTSQLGTCRRGPGRWRHTGQPWDSDGTGTGLPWASDWPPLPASPQPPTGTD